ncbi:MAG: hypothetical protein IKB53_06270 [Oscillospiraceae bacterium]|nr:hypothetical protein [Oscillospiraceae bacterium]
MKNDIKQAFDAVQADERLKRQTKAYLRRATLDYGRDTWRRRQRRTKLASCAAALVLMVVSAGMWLLPVTSIDLDINPSLEFRVNSFGRVTKLKGMNADGLAIVDELSDVKGMRYDDAMQRILISKALEPYLENESLISITVVGKDESLAEQMLSKVVCRAYAIADEDNIYYCQTDPETARAARSVGLCVLRYQVWQQLKESDPTITVEAVALMPKAEVMALAKFEKLDNPCGE